MKKTRPHILVLMIIAMVLQPVLTVTVSACQQHDPGLMNISGESSGHNHHAMHKATESDPGDSSMHESKCDCGIFCNGSCQHACHGYTLLDTVFPSEILTHPVASHFYNPEVITFHHDPLLRPPILL